MRLVQIINKIIEYGFYALFIITPFIFNPNRSLPSYELFEFNKMMFVYALTVIISSAWIIRMLALKKQIWTRTPFDIPLLLFLGAQFLATLFSIDRHVSIFGYYSRFHGGLLSTISYVVLFYAFVSNRDLINLKKLLGGVLIAGAGVAFYGILERFGIDAHMWVQDVQARVFSTLGQPNWLAAYLTILLPISIGFGIKTTEKQQELNQPRIKNQELGIKGIGLFGNWFYWIIGLLLYICLLFTKSRSGFLGFWLANALFWAGYLYSSSGANAESRSFSVNGKFSLRSNTILKPFLILNSCFLILNFFLKSPFPAYNRIATTEIFVTEQAAPATEEKPIGSSVIDVGITDSGKIREIVWKGAVEIIKEYPLFGTGPETFAYAYYKYRPQEHNLTSEWDFLYNRAHNEFLNVGATSGFVGLTTYLFFISTVTIFALNKLRRTSNRKDFLLLLSFLCAFTGIHITNFFGFSVVIVGVYFFLLPGFFITISYKKPEYTSVKTIALWQKIGVALILLLGSYGLFKLGVYWVTDSYYARAYSLRRQENLTDAYSYIVAATQLRPDEPVYHDERSTIASDLSTLAFNSADATTAAELAQEAIVESSQALSISPQNVNFWKSRTRILYDFSLYDSTFIDSALESISIAAQLAPTDAKIAYNRAVLLGESKQAQEATKELERAIALKPDYRDAYLALAIFYEQEKMIDQAKQTLQLVLERINPEDQEVKTKLEELK